MTEYHADEFSRAPERPARIILSRFAVVLSNQNHAYRPARPWPGEPQQDPRWEDERLALALLLI